MSKFDTFTWRAFFYLTAFIMTLTFTYATLTPNLSLFDYIDLVISTLATIGLYGLAFQTAIKSVVFWRYFFYVVTIETLTVTVVFPLLGIPTYGQPFVFTAWYFVGSVFFAVVIYGNYLYAYKQPKIWLKQ